MANKTRGELILELLADWQRQHGYGAIAEELIEKYDNDNPGQSLPERVRFGKEVHGTLSQLYDAGKVARSRTRLNPASGAEVYEYVIETIQRAPRDKVSKSYKEKYELLVQEISLERSRKEKQVNWLIQKKDEALADVKRLTEEVAILKAFLRLPA